MKPLIIVAHAIIILLAYSAPFWLDYRLVALGVAVYYIQLAIFGGCVLSLKQFNGEKKTFHEWYLAKLGIRPDPIQLRFVLNNIIPGVLLLIAVLWQVVLQQRPLLEVRI